MIPRDTKPGARVWLAGPGGVEAHPLVAASDRYVVTARDNADFSVTQQCECFLTRREAATAAAGRCLQLVKTYSESSAKLMQLAMSDEKELT